MSFRKPNTPVTSCQAIIRLHCSTRVESTTRPLVRVNPSQNKSVVTLMSNTEQSAAILSRNSTPDSQRIDELRAKLKETLPELQLVAVDVNLCADSSAAALSVSMLVSAIVLLYWPIGVIIAWIVLSINHKLKLIKYPIKVTHFTYLVYSWLNSD